jgi:hypothetical protein
MSRRRTIRLLLLILGAVVSSAPVASGAGAGQTDPAGFVATASAQDARFTYSVLGFAAVEDVVDGGGTVAQAQLDGGGNSRSFAALPYPGDLVVNGPGLFAFATGQQLPGGYPFFVAAEHPLRPEAKLDGPGGRYSLLAQAAPQRSAGEGRLQLGEGQSGGMTHGQAVTEVTGDGTVRSTATSVTEGLVLAGGQFRIGTVRSSSLTTLARGADHPTSTSSLVVEGMTVGGTPVTVGPDGLSIAGSPVPGGAGLQGVKQTLAQAGIEVQLVEAQAHHGGERARSLEIRFVATPPLPGSPPQQVVISFGGATTAISVGESLPGALLTLPPGTITEPAPPTGADTAVAVDAPAPQVNFDGVLSDHPAVTVRGPTGAAPMGSDRPVLDNDSPATPPGAGGAQLGASASAAGSPLAQSPRLRQVTLARGLRHPITAFYLPLVAGAALTLAGGFLWLTGRGISA